MKPLFLGCATALVTPFRHGQVDWDALDAIVETQIEAGIDGLVATGTTGEPATLTWEEHLAVIERVVRQSKGRVPVIAGTGSNATKEAVDASKAAADHGADALLVVTPYYNKTSQAGLVAHFNAIADATPLPTIVYNVPIRTGINITPKALQQICQHDRVVGVKEAHTDVGQAILKLRLCGQDAAFYSGNDDLTVPLMACGFQGLISVASNLIPSEMVKMTHLMNAGMVKEAGALQLRLQPLIDALFIETNPIPIKAAMSMVGMCGEEVRLPLIPMQPDTRQVLRQAMADLNLPLTEAT